MQEIVLDYLKKGILLSPEIEKTGLQEHNSSTNVQELVLNPSYIRKAPSFTDTTVEINNSFIENNTKITMKDFVSLYNSRYLFLNNLLGQRRELQNIVSIRKSYTFQKNETISFIAMVLEIHQTNKGNYILTLEDPTGTIKAIITKRSKEAHTMAKELTPDEVIGVQCAKGSDVVFVNNIVFPDIPLTTELKKSPIDEAAVFISDIHIGSHVFLEESFEKFIKWIRGETGTPEQKSRAKKVKYLFIIGDLVEGIGVFPGQEKELTINNLNEQYAALNKYLSQIPKHITLIMCPGNHDSVRIAEPQPPISLTYFKELQKNNQKIILVSSPSTITIGKTGKFEGFNVLLYHGYSFPFYGNNNEKIRLKGGMEATEEIMKYLLIKRHLAPTHGSTRYQLGYEEDPLIIKTVPDFFVTGHIHRATVEKYRNITLLNCSCWISQTPYQEKRGIHPQPARAIYVDLHTRKTKTLNFEEK